MNDGHARSRSRAERGITNENENWELYRRCVPGLEKPSPGPPRPARVPNRRVGYHHLVATHDGHARSLSRQKGDYQMYDEHEHEYHRFRDPGGRSALHPGKRTHPCPTCGEPNRLTAKDVRKGYQCDRCADQAESGCDY